MPKKRKTKQSMTFIGIKHTGIGMIILRSLALPSEPPMNSSLRTALVISINRINLKRFDVKKIFL